MAAKKPTTPPMRTSARQASNAAKAQAAKAAMPAPSAKVTKPAANTKAKRAKAPAAAAKTATTVKRQTAAQKAAAQKKTAALVKTAAAAKKSAEAAARPTKKAIGAKKAAAKPAPAKKAPAKKAPAKKVAAQKITDTNSETQSTASAAGDKRKATEEPIAPPPKKVKIQPHGPVINNAPTSRLNIYVCGEGSAGELGLGTSMKAIDVKRPRLNPKLDSDKVGVVQIAAGGMHVVALTHDNKILTWGVNDQGALGRTTKWEGGLKPMDAPENSEAAPENSNDSDDDDDSGLNPHEATPGVVEFPDLPEGTKFTQVTAGDSCTFALTDDGRVWGWGTFRDNDGIFGFLASELAKPKGEGKKQQNTPYLIQDLKKVVSISAGANHVIALDNSGVAYAWGVGQQNQLGRREVERVKAQGLYPRSFGLPKGAKNSIVKIASGAYHSFAIDKKGNVYGWGLNNFGQTGCPEDAGVTNGALTKPEIIKALQGKTIDSIGGGGFHSIALTSTGDTMVWGRIDNDQLGIPMEKLLKLPDEDVMWSEGKLKVVLIPQKVEDIEGKPVLVATNSDHNIVVTEDGEAFSWGFSENYQTGQGDEGIVKEPTLIENTAVRDVKITGATTGGQFTILYAEADEQ